MKTILGGEEGGGNVEVKTKRLVFNVYQRVAEREEKTAVFVLTYARKPFLRDLC